MSSLIHVLLSSLLSREGSFSLMSKQLFCLSFSGEKESYILKACSYAVVFCVKRVLKLRGLKLIVSLLCCFARK